MAVVRIALRNLWLDMRRAALVALALAFGVGVLVFLWGFNDGAHEQMRRNLQETITGSLAVHARGWFAQPKLRRWIADPEKVRNALRRAGAERIAVRVRAVALVAAENRSQGARLLGVEPAAERQTTKLARKITGRWFSGEHAAEVIIGRGMARTLGVDVGATLVLLAPDRFDALAAELVRCVGIIESGEQGLDRGLVIAPIGFVRRLLSLEREAHEVIAVLPDERTTRRVQKAVRASLGEDFEVLRWDEMYPVMRQWIEIDDAFMYIFLGIVLIVASAGVAAAAMMRTLERTAEFGVMRALGATKGFIAAVVIVESLVVAAVGTALGAAGGIGAVGIAARYGIDLSRNAETLARYYFDPVVHPMLDAAHLAQTIAASLLVAVLASLWPAWRAATIPPTEAIRGV